MRIISTHWCSCTNRTWQVHKQRVRDTPEPLRMAVRLTLVDAHPLDLPPQPSQSYLHLTWPPCGTTTSLCIGDEVVLSVLACTSTHILILPCHPAPPCFPRLGRDTNGSDILLLICTFVIARLESFEWTYEYEFWWWCNRPDMVVNICVVLIWSVIQLYEFRGKKCVMRYRTTPRRRWSHMIAHASGGTHMHTVNHEGHVFTSRELKGDYIINH